MESLRRLLEQMQKRLSQLEKVKAFTIITFPATGTFIPPKMTTAQRDALSSPDDGTLIYNTTTNKFQGRASGAWVDLH